jgi:hypothetical protein
MPADSGRTWASLPAFDGTIAGNEHVLLVASTGGSKSTLVASLTLPVASLVAIDEKSSLRLPRARVVELPALGTPEFPKVLRAALAWRDTRRAGETNRVILRPNVLDIDSFDAHDAIFRAVYERRYTILWIDEITATGATPARVQPWLRGLVSRGRTRGIGVWTCTQAPFGLTPGIVRRNATYLVLGPLDPDDTKEINRPAVDIATHIPLYSGRFLIYRTGEREPYRLFVPIPPALQGWKAP